MYPKYLYFFLGWFLLPFSLLGQQEQLKDEIRKIIQYDTEISYKNTPGFIIGIIDHDSNYIVPFGTADINSNEALNPTDEFELGSVSKTFTASLISILVNSGELNNEDLVNDIIPSNYKNDRLSYLKISDLLNHTSGFPKRPKDLGKRETTYNDPYKNYTKVHLLNYYRSFIPKVRKFEYSHINYALLEIIIEKITRMTFDQALSHYLLEPLEMTSTFGIKESEAMPILTNGYDKAGKVSTPWSFQSFTGSEGLHSNLTDLMSFVHAQLGESHTSLDDILNKNTTKETSTFNEKLSISDGWHTINIKNGDLYVHTGRTGGHSVYIGMVKETKTAVIVLSNSFYGTGDLGTLILRMINQNWRRNPNQ